MLTTERVQSKHRRSLRAFAEAIECRGGLCVRQRLRVVELRERCVGRLEVGAEHAPAIGASKLLRPKRIRLVLQDVAAHERERSLERAAGRMRRLMRRALEQLIEAVEIQLDKIGSEAIGLCLGDDE